MRRKLVALAVLGVALSAPGAFATAAHATVDCRLLNFAEPTTTGQDVFEGAATGYIIGNPLEAVSVRCVVRVNGTVRAATATGAGTGMAVVADRMTYSATETDVVQLCAQYTTSHGSGETCFGTINIQMPPQEVVDAFDAVVGPVAQVLVDAANSLNPCVSVVNLGTCNSGVCIVNTGTCDGGFCVVNTNYCGPECVAVVNTGICGVPRVRIDPR